MITRSIRFIIFVLSFVSVASAQTSTDPVPADPLPALRHDIDSGHADEALAKIEQLRTANSPAPGLDRLEGLAFYSKDELRKADLAFAAALQHDSTDVESTQMRGITLFRLGRPSDAIPLLESTRNAPLIKADPNYVLGLCYMDTRRYDDARRAFATQYGFGADTAPAYLVAARMSLRREYLPIAKGFAEKSLEIDPTLPLAHELLGEIALAGNHLDDAIVEFEKERVRNPLESIVYDRLGDAYVRSARYDDAQRTLQEAILLQPNSTGPYILLGKTLLKKSDPLAASTYLEHAEQLDPANYMTHSLLGQAYRSMGRLDDASRETTTAEKLQAANEPKLDSVH